LTVREKVGRRRYICLRVMPPPSREALRKTLSALFMEMGIGAEARVMTVHGSRCVICVPHTALQAAISALNGRVGAFDMQTLIVSGTMKKIREVTGGK